MVHAVHHSIQVYQDFHRQTLSHLQKLEQSCYKLMPQFDLEQILGMVERAHRMKAGARYLHLTGFEKLSFHVKGRYMALMGLSMTFDREFLKQLIQMKELFRLCLLSNVATWQADLENVVGKLPVVFQSLDQVLNLQAQFSLEFPSKVELEADIQRLLVAIVLIPELARLDMMLKNTPASKLSEILTSQLPRLQALAQQLQLQEIQRSMQISLLEIQARPSHAKAIGTQALLKWSDLSYQTLTSQASPPIHLVTDQPPSSFQQACTTHFEAALMDTSVALIEGNEDRLVQTLQVQAEGILNLARTFQVADLQDSTETIRLALRYHPDQSSLIGRLAVQNWLKYQLRGLINTDDLSAHRFQSSETLLDLAQKPLNWDDIPTPSHTQDPMLMSLLSQVEMPDGFREFASEDSRTIAINSDDLDNLLLRLQRCQQELEQLPTQSVSLSQAFQSLLDDYYRLISMPLSQVFSRFQPMVDALGLQSYKEVNLQVSGGQLTIDRHQGETVYELLVPLISNAVVHGLEKADERQRQGKSRKGRVFISAYAQGSDLLIELRDDGRGLNFEVLREWVIRQYGLSMQEGSFLTESELLDYIFRRQHGKLQTLSQSEDVGLGALQGALDQLNGSIEVSTVMTQGTTFRIMLPKLIVTTRQVQLQSATTALVQERSTYGTSGVSYSLETLRFQGQDGPTLQLGTQGLFTWADSISVFILECDRIEEYVMPHVTEAHQTQTSLTWRDQVIPIFSLRDFLGGEPPDEEGLNNDVILVVRGEQQFLALRAPMHHLVGETSLNINPLSQALAAPRYIYGTTQLATEPPRLVVDVAALIAQQPLQSLFPLSTSSSTDIQSNPPEPRDIHSDIPQIMVVDDSRTAREIVSLTLRQGGYDVIHAKDGKDALEQLRGQESAQQLVDLVISDVAMPRMNGLEFLRQCRQDKALQALPIAMLSNCDSTTHSDLALKEGANAYLTKPYDEDVFLAEIARLLETVPQAVSGT